MKNNELVVRRARPEDLEAIVELAVEMVVHSVSPFRDIDAAGVREFRRRDLTSLTDAMKQPHVGVFVAESEIGRVIGHVIVMCGYMESSTGENQGWVFDLSVREEYWSRGLGKRLMEEAEAFTRQQGQRYLGLGVTSANDRAVTFYEKLGFAEERKRMIKRLD